MVFLPSERTGGNIMISKEKKAAIIAEYGRKPGDTGKKKLKQKYVVVVEKSLN